MSRILCFDPSGNWSKSEGKGVTGFAVYNEAKLQEFGDIKASDSNSVEEHWLTHLRYITEIHPSKIICESYRLQAGKQMQQTWSQLETPQLIGAMRMQAYKLKIPFILQDPSTKKRVNDDILERWGIIEAVGNGRYKCMGQTTNLHQRDAIRHGIFYLKYKEENNAIPSSYITG